MELTTTSYVTSTNDDAIYLDSLCGNETFWAGSVAFDTHYPTWSACFENTVLTWIVCGLLWICTPGYCLYLWRRNLDIMHISVIANCRRSPLNIAKLVAGILLTLLSFTEVVYVAVKCSHDQRLSYLLSAVIRMITMVIVTLLIAVEFRRLIYTSGFLSCYWLLYVIYYTAFIYTYKTLPHHSKDIEGSYELANSLIALKSVTYALVIIQFVLICIVDKTVLQVSMLQFGANPCDANLNDINLSASNNAIDRAPLVISVQKNMSPQRSASFFSNIFFFWVIALLARGCFKAPTKDTLFDLLPTELCGTLLSPFTRLMQRTTSARSESSRYIRCLLKSVGFEVVFAGFMRLMTIALLFVNLLLFRMLIKSVELKSPYPWHGMMYACLLFLVTLLRGLLCTHWLYWCDKAGMHLRSLITSTVYRKVR